jgi:hypothetical protein
MAKDKDAKKSKLSPLSSPIDATGMHKSFVQQLKSTMFVDGDEEEGAELSAVVKVGKNASTQKAVLTKTDKGAQWVLAKDSKTVAQLAGEAEAGEGGRIAIGLLAVMLVFGLLMLGVGLNSHAQSPQGVGTVVSNSVITAGTNWVAAGQYAAQPDSANHRQQLFAE